MMSNSQRGLLSQRRRQHGVATVEAAIALPVLIIILVIIVDFGRAMYSGITTSNAARSAVGFGAQATAIAVDHAGMVAAALADAENLPINGANPAHVDATARHFCRCPGSSSEVSCTSSGCGQAPEVYVEVTTSRDFGTAGSYPGVPSDFSLSRTAVMRVTSVSATKLVSCRVGA